MIFLFSINFKICFRICSTPKLSNILIYCYYSHTEYPMSSYWFILIKVYCMFSIQMDRSSSIRYWFDVEIPWGKFVKISSILNCESAWKLWHRFEVKISMWIWLSKLTKYWWFLHLDFSMSLWHQIDVTTVFAVSILSFPNIFFSWNLF